MILYTFFLQSFLFFLSSLYDLVYFLSSDLSPFYASECTTQITRDSTRADLDTRLEVNHGISYQSYGAHRVWKLIWIKSEVKSIPFFKKRISCQCIVFSNTPNSYTRQLSNNQWNSVLTGREFLVSIPLI